MSEKIYDLNNPDTIRRRFYSYIVRNFKSECWLEERIKKVKNYRIMKSQSMIVDESMTKSWIKKYRKIIEHDREERLEKKKIIKQFLNYGH